MARTHRAHVVPASGGWEVRSSSSSHKAVYKTRRDAEVAARTFVKRKGGGEVYIHGRDGRIKDADSVGKGKIGREIKDPPSGGRLKKGAIRDAVWNGSKALRAK